MKVKMACGHSVKPYNTTIDISNKTCGACLLLQQEEKYLQEITGLEVTASNKEKHPSLKYFQFRSKNRILFSTFDYKKAKAFAIGYVCGKNSYNIT